MRPQILLQYSTYKIIPKHGSDLTVCQISFLPLELVNYDSYDFNSKLLDSVDKLFNQLSHT